MHQFTYIPDADCDCNGTCFNCEALGCAACMAGETA